MGNTPSIFDRSNDIVVVNGDDNSGFYSKWLMPTTETTLNTLKGYFETYRGFVKQNPLFISEVESAIYWISYLLTTTRFHNSRIVSELLYSCSKLLTHFNDDLLRKSYSIKTNVSATVHHLHTLLSFIDYVQVFLELTALKLYGSYGKWILIAVIQLIKVIVRLLLLFYFGQGLSRHNYIIPINRAKEYERFQMRSRIKSGDEKRSEDEAMVLDEEFEDSPESGVFSEDDGELERISFQLPSSGRFIRNIKMAPPKDKRMWITPIQSIRLKRLLQKQHCTSPLVTKLSRQRLIGELIHIMRPLVHLTSGALVGGIDKWIPYLLSFSLDVVSLRLLCGNSNTRYNLSTILSSGKNKNDPQNVPVEEMWNWSEQLEIQRRYLSLLMYLLRSPYYDQHMKQRLLRILSLFANHIPIFGRLLKPFILILPEWQRVYFHLWS